MRVSFAGLDLTRTGSLVVFVGDGSVLSPSAAKLNDLTKGAVRRAMKASRFNGAARKTLTILSPAGVKAERILLVGTGKATELDALAAQNIGGAVAGALAAAPTGYRGATMAVHSTVGFGMGFVGSLAVGVVLDMAGATPGLGWGLAFALMGLGCALGPIALMLLGRPRAARVSP